MSIDLTLVGNYLKESDNLDTLDEILDATDRFSRTATTSALRALFERVESDMGLERQAFMQLSNKQKFYLVRGAYPDREADIRKFVLERFYKASS